MRKPYVHRLNMNESATMGASTSIAPQLVSHIEKMASAEHDWGSHIGCNFDRMFVGEICSVSCGQVSYKQLLRWHYER